MVWCKNSGRNEHKYAIPLEDAFHYQYNPQTNKMELVYSPDVVDWVPCDDNYNADMWEEMRETRINQLNYALDNYKIKIDKRLCTHKN